jgi:molybdate/tungstate transport system ATP-binding protein
MTMLRVESLAVDRDGFTLGEIDLQLGPEVLSILGPSGCGKTSLVQTVAGHIEPDRGRIHLGDEELTGVPPEKRRAAVVFQDGALFPHLTARENIAYGASDARLVASLAEALAVTDILEQPADTLSGGEQQRVALARALATDPEVLLLDEPLANLDTPIRRRLRGDISEILADVGVPVVYVTHDQRAAAAIGDRLAIMRDGQIQQVGPPETVFRSPETAFVAEFTGGAGLLQGKVIHVDGDYGVAIGDEMVEIDIAGPLGRRVCLAVRRDAVELVETDGENRYQGTVSARLFEGDRHRIQISLRSGETVEVDRSPSLPSASVPQVGDEVTVHIPPRALHPVGEH